MFDENDPSHAKGRVSRFCALRIAFHKHLLSLILLVTPNQLSKKEIRKSAKWRVRLTAKRPDHSRKKKGGEGVSEGVPSPRYGHDKKSGDRMFHSAHADSLPQWNLY